MSCFPASQNFFCWLYRKSAFNWTLRPITQLAENPKIWRCYYWKNLVMPVLVEAVKNDSFLGPMTAGSGNLDFLWSQPLLLVSPVLLVHQSCLKVHWLGHNRCPISWCVLNFMSFDSIFFTILMEYHFDGISNTHCSLACIVIKIHINDYSLLFSHCPCRVVGDKGLE